MSNKSVVHPQQICQINVILCFQETNKGEWMWKEVFIIQTINQRKQPLNTSKRDDSVLVWIRKKGQEGTIIGKRCPVLYYTENKMVTIDPYKKEILNGFQE